MSISTYEFLSIVLAQRGNEPKVATNSADYMGVLESVRSSIALEHSQELGAALDDVNAVQTLKTLILKYTTEYMAGIDYDRDGLVERIYQDMAGMGVLTRYLQDPTVEEININAYNFLEILRPTGTEYLYDDDAFASPEAALDIVKRMVRMGGKILDAQTPRVDSFIGSSTRISASIPPLISKACGVSGSIRKQSKSRITREMLIEAGTASPEMLDFMTMCLCNHTSIGIAGSTGSGKSSLENFCVNEYITHNEDYNNRVLTIEDKYVFQGESMMQDTVGSVAEGQRQVGAVKHSEEGKKQCCQRAFTAAGFSYQKQNELGLASCQPQEVIQRREKGEGQHGPDDLRRRQICFHQRQRRGGVGFITPALHMIAFHIAGKHNGLCIIPRHQKLPTAVIIMPAGNFIH